MTTPNDWKPLDEFMPKTQQQLDLLEEIKEIITCSLSTDLIYNILKLVEGEKNKSRDKGIEMASEIANYYNSSTTHPYMLGDCILGKLNVIKGTKIRKNKQRLKEN